MNLRFLLPAAALLPAFTLAAQPVPRTAPADPRFQIPPTDTGLPGAGPIRRAEWFQETWTQRRSTWASRGKLDQHALVFLGDSITQG